MLKAVAEMEAAEMEAAADSTICVIDMCLQWPVVKGKRAVETRNNRALPLCGEGPVLASPPPYPRREG